MTEHDSDKEFEQALGRVTRAAQLYSHKTGLPMNPDPAVRDYVLRGLARNLIAHGSAYCPCREVTGDAEADRANICPCRTHVEDVQRNGVCDCGLYVSLDTMTELSFGD